jgi:hypothetical protein
MTCAQCRHTGGWLEDEATGKPVGRCPCMHRTVTGPAVAADAHPQALDAAVRIIRDAARARTTFSSNDIRHQLDAAQVHGPVVGAAFSKCARDGMIRHAGDYVPSTDPGTHGHPVKVWVSRLYRGSAA